MTAPYLIQRLLPPFKNAAENRGRPSTDMVFGGARDLTQDQHDFICDLFRLDNMGSAHFEFRAIPDALDRLANNAGMRAYQIDMALTPAGGTLSHFKLRPKMQTFHILSTPNALDETLTTIKSLAEGHENGLARPADVGWSVFLDDVIAKRPFYSGSNKAIGWHDIENDILFFTDQSMFNAVRERFKIVGDVTPLPQMGEVKAKAPRRKKTDTGPAPSV